MASTKEGQLRAKSSGCEAALSGADLHHSCPPSNWVPGLAWKTNSHYLVTTDNHIIYYKSMNPFAFKNARELIITIGHS